MGKFNVVLSEEIVGIEISEMNGADVCEALFSIATQAQENVINVLKIIVLMNDIAQEYDFERGASTQDASEEMLFEMLKVFLKNYTIK